MHVYALRNMTNGKLYIGQTTQNLDKYMNSVFYKALHGDAGKPKLFNAIRKHGREAFEVIVLCACDTLDELNQIERGCIALFRTQEKELGYNVAFGGSNGQTHAESTKQKLREINLGKKASDVTRQLM